MGFDVANKYQDAKNEFIKSGVDSKLHDFMNLGGMTNCHMPGTYYFLSKNYDNKLKEVIYE